MPFGHRAGAVIAAARAPQPVFSAPDPLPTIRPPQENPRHHDIIDNNHVNAYKNSHYHNNSSHHTNLGCPEGDAWIISQLQRIGASLALFLGGNCRIGVKVAVAGVEPPVDDLDHSHVPLADVQLPRFGIGEVAGVAFDPEERTLFRAGFFL